MFYRDLQSILARIRTENQIDWFPTNASFEVLVRELGKWVTRDVSIRESVIQDLRANHHQLYEWLLSNRPYCLSGCSSWIESIANGEPFSWLDEVGSGGKWIHTSLVRNNLRIYWGDMPNGRLYGLMLLDGRSLPSDFVDSSSCSIEQMISIHQRQAEKDAAFENFYNLLANYEFEYMPVIDKMSSHQNLYDWWVGGLIKISCVGNVSYQESPEETTAFRGLELPGDWESYSPHKMYEFIASNTWLWQQVVDALDLAASTFSAEHGNTLVWREQPGQYDAVLGGGFVVGPRDGDAVLGGVTAI